MLAVSLLLSSSVNAIRQESLDQMENSQDDLTSQFFNFMEISEEQTEPKVEDHNDRKTAWNMKKKRSEGFTFRNKQLINDKNYYDQKTANEKTVFEEALADNQNVELDDQMAGEEDAAVEAVKQSLSQIGIKVPEGKNDIATVQILLQQALEAQQNLSQNPVSPVDQKPTKVQMQPSKSSKNPTLIDISRKESTQELGKDIKGLQKEIKVDEVTINLLQKRLKVAQQTLNDHQSLLKSKQDIKEEKEAENIITIEDASEKVSLMEKKDDKLEAKVKADKKQQNKLVANEIRQSEPVKKAINQAQSMIQKQSMPMSVVQKQSKSLQIKPIKLIQDHTKHEVKKQPQLSEKAKKQDEPAAEEPAAEEAQPAETPEEPSEQPEAEEPAEQEDAAPLMEAPAEEDASGDPYDDADFGNIEMDEMSDYAAEERQALKEPLRLADMKSMEESIQKIAAEVSGGIDQADSAVMDTQALSHMSLMEQASLNKWRHK